MFNFAEEIQPVSLPSQDEINASFEGELGTVVGWGWESDRKYLSIVKPIHTNIPDSFSVNEVLSPTLRYVETEIISNEKCSESLPINVSETNVCASGENGKSPCHVRFI